MQARSIAVIQQQIIDNVKANKTLYDPTNSDVTKRGLTSTSMAAIWILWTYIMAVAINIFENIMVLFQIEIEALVNSDAQGTAPWLQRRVLEFQYNVGNPQVAQYLPDNTIGYPIINDGYKIITQCAVVTTPNKIVLVKVTKGGIPLNSSEQIALNDYLDILCFAGIGFQVRSVNADLIMCGIDIYYNGQYNTVINTTVSAAITDYLSTLPFNGVVTLTALIDKIQQVPGVTDVLLKQIEIRPASVLPADATVMVSSYDWILRNNSTYSGNCIVDTASGRTLADTLTFIPV